MAEQHFDDLHADFETRSRVNLKTAGVRRYAADPSTQVTTAVWRFRGQWKTACTVHPYLGTHTLVDLFLDVRECRRFVAHNAAFDVSILHASNPWDRIPLEKIDCTMGRAQSLSLPGGLDDVNKALGIAGKDPRGKQLVMATCKPKKDGTFNEDPQTFKELLEYNVQDVRCLIELDKRLPALSDSERLIFERTWRKNERGLPIDVELAEAIAQRRQDIEEEAQRTLLELTGGAVTKLSQRQRILTWCASKGAHIESTQKYIVAETLADESLHPDVRQLMELLQESGGSAPLKAQSLLDRQVDGSYKDGTRYFGARSGRGTSEGTNMFNITRPSGKYEVDEVIAGLKLGFKYGNTALSDSLRGIIVAPPGHKIIDIDLSNAEYRLAMWLADDKARIKLLEDGGDPYMHNAIQMGWCPPGATKKTHPKERQDAKPCLSADTLVLTRDRGWRRIVDIQRNDMLWDGGAWVSHGGVICKGVKETQDVLGVRATSDHKIFTSPSDRALPFGAMARGGSGLQLALSTGSSAFSAACQDTTTPILTWTGRTTNADTSRETCDSSRQGSTAETSERSDSSKRFEPVYDIVDCGPRHRFLISSRPGVYLLAANCTLGGNYQLGWRTYMAHQRRSGNAITDEQAQSDIAAYRKANPLLVELWNDLGDTFRQCIYDKPGRRYNVHMLSFEKDTLGTVWIILPSGRGIPHYNAHITPEGQMAFYRAKFGAMREQKVFGGGILEIFAQGTTRDLLTLAEADIERELPDVTLLLDVYDSILAIAPEDVAEQRADEMRAIMRRVRPWAQGLPVDAEYYVAERMRK